jgi:hypothetical protein
MAPIAALDRDALALAASGETAALRSKRGLALTVVAAAVRNIASLTNQGASTIG